MQLEKQLILITGGASGIGLATTRFFHQLGARVIALDRRADLLNQLGSELDIDTVNADISQADVLEEAFSKMVNEVGVPRAVVHCAGILDGARAVGRDGPMPLSRFEKVIQVNLVGTFNVLRLAGAAIMQQPPLNDDGERGVMIMTASVAAFDGQVGQLAYSAAKGGVAAMTLPAAREFAPFGIRVMTIAPGIIHTPMMGSLSQEIEASLVSQVPFPKRLGYAEEYARLAQHIIENTYLNGEIIRLDAGLRMAAK